MSVIPFPIRQLATTGASWIQRHLKDHLAISFGKLARWFGLPGAIQDVHINDAVSGQEIDIRVGLYFTRISVNGRDYYFRRYSGRLDGTGMGCSCASGPKEVVE